MTLAGWIFMIVSWTLIVGVMVYSYARILSKEEDKKT